MKILIIGPSIFPIPAINGGAIEGLIDSYLKHNSKTGKFDITIYSPYITNIDKNIQDKYNNTEFRYINKKSLLFQYFRIKSKISKLLNRRMTNSAYSLNVIYNLKKRKELEKYDLVIIENQIESLVTYRKHIKSKLIEHLHNDNLNVTTPNAKRIVKSCDEFWGVSSFIVNQINTINKEVETKVLYNGVDIDKFSEIVTQDDKNRMYEKIGFSKKDFIIIYVGRIMPEKGLLQLMRVFNNIKKYNESFKLLIIGSQKNQSKEIKKYCTLINKEKNKNNDSIYFYGNAGDEELRVLYSIASIQVVPSIWEEAFGLIAVEGGCAGHPVIVTDSGGLNEIINDPLLVVHRDKIEFELIQKIQELYSKRDEFPQLMKNVQEHIKKFNMENYCKNFDQLIINAIHK